MSDYSISALKQLEAESIHIFREAAATCDRLVMLYSIGKDSSVLLKLAEKAFYPAKIPFQLVHVDTGYKFPEMISFRDAYTRKIGADLVVEKNMSAEAQALGPDDAHTDYYIYHKKTKPLLDVLGRLNVQAAIGGARREEEKARAKERVFSVRFNVSGWDPKQQRPELWHLYNTDLADNQTMRIFPLSNWTELDIWHYIQQEQIELVPLYFAKEMQLVKRHGIHIRVDDFTKPKDGEDVLTAMARYRTLGCAPSTGAVLSTATNVEEIIAELMEVKTSERQNRAIDQTSSASMEKKKREGYF